MRSKRLFRCAVALWLCASVLACDKEGTPYPGGDFSKLGEIEALVLNEGRINTNTGGISLIYKDKNVIADVFQEVNQRPLGDVAQSITMINGKYFVALDNSKKIEVVDPRTFVSLGTILYEQAGSPRQIVPISDTEAVVSDLREAVGIHLRAEVDRIPRVDGKQSVRYDARRPVRFRRQGYQQGVRPGHQGGVQRRIHENLPDAG